MKNDIAEHKWKKIPEADRNMLLSNVICSGCGMTTIVDYTVNSSHDSIVLRGKCKKCGHKVARVIEGAMKY